jgi:site-specific DNA-methyltransferase (adenine-specific)
MSKHVHIQGPSWVADIHPRDCIDGLGDTNVVQPGSIDVVVTSPPYNLGVRYSSYDDTISRKKYLRWIGDWAKAVHAALSDDGSLFLNVGSKPSDPTVPFLVLERMLKHFELQNTFHWIKSVAIDTDQLSEASGLDRDIVLGHYKPINSKRFVNDCHEYVFHLTKRGDIKLDRLAIGVPYQDKSNVNRWRSAGNDVHCRGNVWFIPYNTISNRDQHRPHPATFPPELPQMCLKLHGVDRIKRVMDPFLGIGNTAVACCRLGLDCIGFEIDSDYFNHAVSTIRGECDAAEAHNDQDDSSAK